MRKCITIIILILFSLSSRGGERLDSLLSVLDDVIGQSDSFLAEKEMRITGLKSQLAKCNGDKGQLYEVNWQLALEYRWFRFDSTAYHLNECINIAKLLPDSDKLTRSRLLLSYHYGSGGRYEAALDILRSINRETLPKSLITQYYASYDHCYGEMVSYHVGEGQLMAQYEGQLNAYKDSLYASLTKDSRLYMQLEEDRYRDTRMIDAALHFNDLQLANVKPDAEDYPVVLYHRAMTYGMAGDSLQQMECFARSAIADIRLAKKDHASLWMLANMLLNAGDVERANRYMQFSWVDTNFYNSPLRFWQSSNIQKIIDTQYQEIVSSRNRRLVSIVIVISVLALLLLLAMLQIMRHKRRLTVAQEELKKINGKLNDLNCRLSDMNDDLKHANASLEESNCIKDVYISRFIKLCSEYIDRSERVRALIQKSLSMGKVDEVKKMVKNSSVLNEEVKLLYQNFDTAFLHIFPDFVAKFNALLQDDEQIVLKPDELLNTELRIFALIRLGFTDSSQIAEILRYSVNTIYNYRAKVKNKARGNRADFEELVRNIH
ncbi:MAG: DUF6377 domain-containing protein [Muribaculaceae bacterium]